MEPAKNLRSNEQYIDELKLCGKTLVEKLQNDKYEDASELIQKVVEARDRHLFNSVGKLTRALHDAIVNFNIDAEICKKQGKEGISDASDRLEYVIHMTQEAAEKTMDRVEIAAPLAEALGIEAKSLKDEWERLRRREMGKSEFAELYGRIDLFLKRINRDTESLNENLQSILLEQGFQDLTGQVLKKVIGLIRDVESELVNLMRIAGQVEEITGITTGDENNISKECNDAEAEGPQIHSAVRDDVVSSQDDVDDLLSSLGF